MRRRAALLAVAALLAAGCAFSEYGPWLSPTGARLEGSQVVEFEGFRECGQEDVVFIRFFGAQYAKDPDGVLGEIRSVDGERVLVYAVLDELPEGAVGTGITHEGREIYLVEDDEQAARAGQRPSKVATPADDVDLDDLFEDTNREVEARPGVKRGA